MNAEFFDAVADIEKEKGIPREYMYEKIRQAMLTAFRKDTPDCEDNVEVILDEDKKKIEELASFNQKLIDTTGGIIVVFDRHAKILLFNPAAEDLLGWKKEEVVGKRFYEIFLPESQHASMAALFPDTCDSYTDNMRCRRLIV